MDAPANGPEQMAADGTPVAAEAALSADGVLLETKMASGEMTEDATATQETDGVLPGQTVEMSLDGSAINSSGDEWQKRDPGLSRGHDHGSQLRVPWADGRDVIGRQCDQGDRYGGWDDPRRAHGHDRGWDTGANVFRSGWYGEDGDDRRRFGRASEKLSVPTFTAEDSEDLGGSARSYLRQVAAWRQMTLLPMNQQGLVLYQALEARLGSLPRSSQCNDSARTMASST